MVKVNKRGVADDIGIGVQHLEANKVEDHT